MVPNQLVLTENDRDQQLGVLTPVNTLRHRIAPRGTDEMRTVTDRNRRAQVSSVFNIRKTQDRADHEGDFRDWI